MKWKHQWTIPTNILDAMLCGEHEYEVNSLFDLSDIVEDACYTELDQSWTFRRVDALWKQTFYSIVDIKQEYIEQNRVEVIKKAFYILLVNTLKKMEDEHVYDYCFLTVVPEPAESKDVFRFIMTIATPNIKVK